MHEKQIPFRRIWLVIQRIVTTTHCISDETLSIVYGRIASCRFGLLLEEKKSTLCVWGAEICALCASREISLWRQTDALFFGMRSRSIFLLSHTKLRAFLARNCSQRGGRGSSTCMLRVGFAWVQFAVGICFAKFPCEHGGVFRSVDGTRRDGDNVSLCVCVHYASQWCETQRLSLGARAYNSTIHDAPAKETRRRRQTRATKARWMKTPRSLIYRKSFLQKEHPRPFMVLKRIHTHLLKFTLKHTRATIQSHQPFRVIQNE